MRLLIIAPFPRGRGQGGSQRATALAERLEERGVEIDWRQVDATPRPIAHKAARMARLEPALVGGYPRPAALSPAPWSAALAAHSFLAPQLDPLPAQVARVVDFHNLEWQHLTDSARLEPPRPGAVGVVRRRYLAAQIALLRRFERQVLTRSDVSLLVSRRELEWAQAGRHAGRLVYVPSVLPRAEEQAALDIAHRREAAAGGTPDTAPGPEFVYVGTLSFPPNAMSLSRFLTTAWPSIRQTVPGARLSVTGDCDAALRADIERHPGVRALGFLDSLAPVLERASAALMPFEAQAGTSLRTLLFALARVPVIGSPDAFRGVGAAFGTPAGTAPDWARAVRELGAPARTDRLEAAQRAALAVQRDPTPWDATHQALAEAVRRRAGVTGR